MNKVRMGRMAKAMDFRPEDKWSLYDLYAARVSYSHIAHARSSPRKRVCAGAISVKKIKRFSFALAPHWGKSVRLRAPAKVK